MGKSMLNDIAKDAYLGAAEAAKDRLGHIVPWNDLSPEDQAQWQKWALSAASILGLKRLNKYQYVTKEYK